MDQIVDRNRPDKDEDGQLQGQPEKEAARSQEALGLDANGARAKRGNGWLYALAAVGIAAAGLAYWQLAGSAPQVSYATVPAQVGDLTVTVSATGTLQPLTQVDISSELSGVDAHGRGRRERPRRTRATCWPSSTRRGSPRRSSAPRPRPRRPRPGSMESQHDSEGKRAGASPAPSSFRSAA